MDCRRFACGAAAVVWAASIARSEFDERGAIRGRAWPGRELHRHQRRDGKSDNGDGDNARPRRPWRNILQHEHPPLQIHKRPRGARRGKTGLRLRDAERQQQAAVLLRRRGEGSHDRGIARRLARDRIFARREMHERVKEEDAFGERRHAPEPQVRPLDVRQLVAERHLLLRLGQTREASRQAAGRPAGSGRRRAASRCAKTCAPPAPGAGAGGRQGPRPAPATRPEPVLTTAIISSVSRQRRNPTSAVSVRPSSPDERGHERPLAQRAHECRTDPGLRASGATSAWRAGAAPAVRRAAVGERRGTAAPPPGAQSSAAGSTGMAIGVVQTSARTNLAAAHHQRTVRVAGDRRRRREMTQTAATRTAPSTDARARVATMAVTGPFLDRCPIGRQPRDNRLELGKLSVGEPARFG